MFIDSPDEVLWRYLELRQKLGSPAARNTVAERGLVFGDECAECEAPEKGARLEQHCEKTRASRWVCSACDAPWPVDVAFLLRNEFQSAPRPGVQMELYALLGTYSQILSGLPLREQRCYLLLYLYENVGDYLAVADEMRRRWPRSHPPNGRHGPSPGGWTEWAVRRTVTDARKRINADLRARGLKGIVG